MKNKLLVLVIFFCLGMEGLTYGQENGQAQGIPMVVNPTKSETVAEIMLRQGNYPARTTKRLRKTKPDRSILPGNPSGKPGSIYPEPAPGTAFTEPVSTSLTLGTNFNGVTGPTETGAFPPDNMGAVGPTQYIVFVNGRLRTFNKTTGVADGILNVDPDAFFASVMTPPAAGEVVFTSDPRIRYDRLSGKWIMVIIDVPLVAATGALSRPNRVLIAYSNTSTIAGGTVWTFSQFLGDATLFADYETLGIDVNALYIGANMFTVAGAFNSTKGYVINRNTLLAGGAYTVYSFPGLVATSTGAGPFTPQGVDNFNFSATEGYFIGVDNATFNTLMLRRVSTPAGVPTISANISIALPLTTRFPVLVPHLGNTGGSGGRLDGLDDRLFAAVMRNGRIWTAHNIGVNNTGVAGATNNRNAARWYELQNIVSPGTPAVVQSGTVYDNSAINDANQVNYWIPSIMVSGQGHAAMGMTTAGTNVRINAAAVGRLSTDVLGTMQTPIPTTASSTAYNPPGDPGGPSRRWGDYSYVSLDPIDDMTMWMVNQFCAGTNTYGAQVTKLLAPPPATPASTSPASAMAGISSINVVLTGTSSSGSGFYDPGADLSSPALPYSHITASVTGGVTVNSITYTDPTHVTLNLNTTGASQGSKNITITNPDGQQVTGNNVFQVIGILPITLKELKGKLNNNLTVSLSWITSMENNNKGFFIERTESNSAGGWTSIGFVNGAGNSSSEKNYGHVDADIQLSKIYRYRLKQVDLNGQFTYSNEVLIRVKDLQKDKLLLSNHPNPFTSIATIKYNLPKAGEVNLKVFDVSGKEVALLAGGYKKAGLHTVKFNAANLGNGTYICKLVFEGETITNQMILVK